MMNPPVAGSSLDQNNATLLWALWHDIDPSSLRLHSREADRVDTMSVQSYDAPYKHTPNFAFPPRKSQYAEVVRVRAMQNKARIRYCSTAPNIQPTLEEEIMVEAKSSTLCEPSSPVKFYQSDTFLTDMPEFYSMDPEMDNVTKICMPAFLPTIQAKTHTKNSQGNKFSAVRRYLRSNELINSVTPTTPHTPTDSNSKLSHLADLEKSVVALQGFNKTKPQKSKKHKTVKYITRYKPTGNRKKRVGKLYIGRNRELSSTNTAPNLRSNNRTAMSYQSFVAPQEDLIMHFSRISMRQVQSTLNNSRLAILPNIS